MAGAVSWLPSGGQLLLLPPFPPLLEVPFWMAIMALLCGGRPLMVVDNGGVEEKCCVENPAVGPTAPGAPG